MIYNQMTLQDGGRYSRTISALFFTFIFLNISFPVFKLGPLPVRILFGVCLLAFILNTNSARLKSAWKICRDVVIFIFLFGLLGSLVSWLNGLPAVDLIQNISEIYLQTILNLVLTMSVVHICGGRSVLLSVIVSIGISSAFAVAQYLGIGGAWSIREAIALFQHEELSVFFYSKRPMGLSFSPIVLATQVCTAFAAYGVYRQIYVKFGRFDMYIMYAAVLFIAICFACGNRSPILGGLLFMMLYGISRRPMFFIPATLLAAAIALPLFDFVSGALSEAGSRVGEIDDKSAAGRFTLIYYGLRLFVAQPWGYGLGFDPTVYWHDYWTEVAEMPNAEVIARYPLHNYILNMLNFYGFFILFFVPKILKYLHSSRGILIFFLPYALHILFHNSGPLWNDTFIWIVIAAVMGGATSVSPARAASRSTALRPSDRGRMGPRDLVSPRTL